MKKIIVLLMSLCAVFSLASCNNNADVEKSSAESSLQNSTEDESSKADKEATFNIKTPYCELKVPESFRDNIKWEETSDEPYVLTFKTKDKKDIFSLHFDDETENLLGTLPLKDENIVVYASFADVKKDSYDYEEITLYQEGINTIIDGLISDYDFILDEVVDYSDDKTFDIKTNVVTLKYPNKWKDKVKIKVSDKEVDFSSNDVNLFTLYFSKEDDGYLLGTYNKTPIYIVSSKLDDSDLNDNERNELIAMQEDINVILQNLMKDENFVINE